MAAEAMGGMLGSIFQIISWNRLNLHIVLWFCHVLPMLCQRLSSFFRPQGTLQGTALRSRKLCSVATSCHIVRPDNGPECWSPFLRGHVRRSFRPQKTPFQARSGRGKHAAGLGHSQVTQQVSWCPVPASAQCELHNKKRSRFFFF